MPTLRTVTVKSAGGDYTSLASAVATECAGVDLVALDRQLTIELYAMADTTRVTIDSTCVTDATRYVRLYVPPAERHGGVAGAGYRLNALANFQKMLSLSTLFIRLEGLSASHTSTAGNTSNRDSCIYFNPGSATSEIRIDNCIVTASPQQGIDINRGVYKIKNTIVYGTGKGPFYLDDSNGDGLSTYVYNCVGVVTTGTSNAFEKAGNGTTNIKNCYGHSSGGSAFVQTLGTLAKTTCASSDATGTSGLTSISHGTGTFLNVTASTENYHLAATSPLLAVGTDLSADANYAFSDDIDGETRPATWSIGADDFTPSIVEELWAQACL